MDMTAARLAVELEARLIRLARLLIDPQRARILVHPTVDAPGYWFGAGNLALDPGDGSLWLIGRYRDPGDSRAGLRQGTRGRALALLRSTDGGRRFDPVRCWSKADLRCGGRVISIEGSALVMTPGRVRVLVSTEKARPYPRTVRRHRKPGTGIWSIDTFAAACVDRLDPRAGLVPLLASADPAYLHRKDPSVSPGFRTGRSLLLYCAHPYTWSSSSSGFARLSARRCSDVDPDFFPRGSTWDVAACRITCRLPVPRVGALGRCPATSLYFYDGAECLRPLEPHPRAATRPRGYSCEELGGLAYGIDAEFPRLHRVSRLAPLFVSAAGTGCSRYVSVLPEPDGGLFATWQASVASRAQPLFGHRLSAAQVRAVLS